MDGQKPVLVGRARGLGIDRLAQLHAPFEDAVVDLDVLIEALVARLASPPAAHDEDAVHDGRVDFGRVDAGQLDDHRDRGRVVGAIDVERGTEARAARYETRHLAKVREELLHLGFHTVDVPTRGHETIVPMPRILKSAALAFGILGYVWVAGVRNIDEVKARKRARRAV